MDMLPCPLCVIQRYLFLAIAIFCVIGAYGAPKAGAGLALLSSIGGLGTAAVKDYGTAAGNLVELSAANKLPALDGFLLSNLNATYLQTSTNLSAKKSVNSSKSRAYTGTMLQVMQIQMRTMPQRA